ncbi:MAG TPA: CbtA family protein, partial [Gammaproteobacteria bacterium]|nr:CbtA family protein [Gammaproteobacteria bacterium]
MLFRRIVFFALLVGALLGALVTAVQYGQVIPLIHEAEQGRMGEGDHGPAANQPPPAGAETENHAASTSGFGPGEAGFTLLANFLTGFGFAVLMLALMIAY